MVSNAGQTLGLQVKRPPLQILTFTFRVFGRRERGAKHMMGKDMVGSLFKVGV